MKAFRERLKEGAYGSVQIISAFVFVVIVGLITIYAAAEKKNEPFNAAVTALGAVGQVFFAYMVWRLGREQFEFTKQVSERQNRIASYPARSKAIEDFERWWSIGLANPDDEAINHYLYHIRILRSLFDRDLDQRLDALTSHFITFGVAHMELELAKRNDEPFTVRIEHETKVARARTNLLLEHGLMLAEMRHNMRLHDHSAPTYRP